MRVPIAVLVVVAAALAACTRPLQSTLSRPPTPAEMAQLWVERPDRRALDLRYGSGGRRLAPAPGSRFTLLREKKTGESRKYDVRDANGLEWEVKLGEEAQPEVAASRLVWAAGYHQPPMYYLSSWRLQASGVETSPPPARFRPDLPELQKEGDWPWRRNVFVGTQPFQGLIVLMAVLVNWDLKDDNNSVYELGTPRDGAAGRWFVVRDLGASFGHAHYFPQGTKNVVEHYEEQEFVQGVAGSRARIGFATRRYRALFHDVTVQDVRWLCERLGQLSDEQLHDAFRAAEYATEERERYVRRLKLKIAEGLALRESR